ncbi:MAG: S1C family serine protease [Ruminococcus sp.]|jgi:serine protease Do
MYDGNYDYYQMNQMPQEPQGPQFQEPQEPPKKKDYTKAKKIGKKVGALVLAGVLVGGSAGLAFQGVSYAMGTGSSGNSQSGSTATLQTASVSSEGETTGQSLDVSDIVEGVMPSVVAITNQSVQEVQNYFSMFGMGGQSQMEEVESAGSGIIVGQNDEELLIVSNNHVVEGADTLSVCFNDGNVYEANIKGTDSDRDLAVIAVPLSDISDDTMSEIKAVEIGDSSSLKVGEQVVAIGNALGYGQSVTTGIVSALDRTLEEGSDATFIQTDAAINPGNSGGALLNMQGQLIGINSAKQASTEVEGMGYAIPVSEVQSTLENLMNRTTREKVDESQRGSLGVSVQDVDSQVSEMYGIPEGAYVAEVTSGSAAENAGIQQGYIITGFDGESVNSVSDLQNLLQYYAAGESVEVTVQVSNGGQYEEQTVSVTLDQAQTQDQTAQQ